MHNYFWITLSLLILLFPGLQAVTTQPHHTTAFIAPPGEIDLLISDAYYTTNHFWNKSGKLLPTYNQFKSNSTLLYAEYAINSRNSLTLNGGYSMVQESLNGNSCGWEDVELGWKSMLYHDRGQVFTAQVIAIIPAGKKKSSIRYGQGGVQGSLLYSDLFLLFEREGWVDLNVGYRIYDGYPSDQFILNLAAGYQLFKWVTVIATGELLYGVNNGRSEDNFNNVIYNPNPRLLNGKIECLASITQHLYLTIGLNKHIWGQNVGAGGGCYAGLWFSY
jgi:hypothetical protein